MKIRLFWLMAGLLALALLVTACSGGDAPADDAVPAAEEEAAAPSEEETSADTAEEEAPAAEEEAEAPSEEESAEEAAMDEIGPIRIAIVMPSSYYRFGLEPGHL